MKAVTLRNLPAEVARAVERRAREQGTSLNRTIIRLLEEAVGGGPKKSKPPYRDLDGFIGSWTEAQARDLEEALREQRRVDPKDWS